VLAGWRRGWPPFRRDLVKFYEALAVFGLAAEVETETETETEGRGDG
jgi:hypothetical protein